MGSTHHIDNDEPMFQIDHFEPLKSQLLLEVASRSPQVLSSNLSPSCEARHPSRMACPSRAPSGQDLLNTSSPADDLSQDKGKAVSPQPSSEPMSILPARAMLETEFDFFPMSLSSAGSSARVVAPIYTSELYAPHGVPYATDADVVAFDIAEGQGANSVDGGKGKGRELPPVLPPLSFTPTEFLYGSADWPSVAGPSSYGSTFSSDTGAHPRTPDMNTTTAPFTSPSSPESPQVIRARVPSRARSLSNLSLRSRNSLSNLSMNKVKLKFATSKLPGNLAKKLFKRRDDSTPSTPTSPFSEPDILSAESTLVDVTMPGCDVLGPGNCIVPWAWDMKPRTPLATPVVGTEVAWGSIDPIYRSPRPTDPHPLRTKGRSYSSPLPLPSSPLDIVPTAPADIFAPLPDILPNYFDELLPHELKVQVLLALVRVHQAEHERRAETAKWTAIKAGTSRNKWVGRDKGIRELFRLSRVSHCWYTMVFDGQLWAKLDLRSLPKLPSSLIDRIGQTAGAFVSTVDLSGHTTLLPSTLHEFTNNISVRPPVLEPGLLTLLHTHTQLTSINLRGCTLLTTHSLHTLLIRSPLLERLYVKGLTAVTNTTCEILASYCPRLVTLDVSRCHNMNAEGIHTFATMSLARGEPTKLKSLRIAGLKRITDDTMAALGRVAPLLEVLDISGARDLHNSAIEAFVACTEEEADAGIFEETVHLSSRDAGRDPTDPNRVWRRVTRLRHLSLTACITLTDHACSHLAFAVPKLEFLELAGIGPELRDSGVVRLLNTTPYIRRVDLEDATEISDDVLIALTPMRDSGSQAASSVSLRTSLEPPEPGHALEQIILSYTDITNEALLALIRKCPRLRVLEADNTQLSGAALRAFVSLSRERQRQDARIVAIDCRNVSESLVKDLTAHTRPRLGWRSWHARKLAYLDARDEEGLNVGQDECDPSRVVIKTFYSWQTVDAVRAAREKKRKSSGSRRGLNASSSSELGDEGVSAVSGRTRWWSPSGRRSSGPGTPTLLDINNGDREGCTIM